jgi:hypothetical protein
MWVDLFFNTFACIGLCAILKYGTILSPIRSALSKIKFFRELFSCSMCLGFWSGLGIAIITWDLRNIIIWPLYGSAICWASDYVLDILIKLSNQSEDEKDESDLVIINE